MLRYYQGMRRATDARKAAEREAHARARRTEWSGGVVRRGPELDAANSAFWQAVSADKRLGYVFDMCAEQMSLKDPAYEAPARLQRSVGGVRPRRG